MKPILLVALTLATLAISSAAEPATPTVYEVAALDHPPVLKSHSYHFYPTICLGSHQIALVALNVIVDPSGHVAAAKTLKAEAISYSSTLGRTSSPMPGQTAKDIHANGLFGPQDIKNGDSEALTVDSGPFERAALRAVKQWKYLPGQKNGQPVSTRVLVRIDFTENGDIHVTQLP